MIDRATTATETREQLVDEAFEHHRTIGQNLITAATEEWVTLELTMAQLKTMIVLESEGPATVGRIAEILNVGVPTSSHLVNRLVQSNLAQRLEDPADRRRTEVSLTPEGEELLHKLRQGKHSLLRRWMMQMDETDLAALVQALHALVLVMQEEKA
jgi:DNA-binding MarR family transcriptional regulator